MRFQGQNTGGLNEKKKKEEDAIWKVFAAYTALFAGLAVAKDMLGFFGFIMLIVVFSLLTLGLG